jgi:hypothetical protein
MTKGFDVTRKKLQNVGHTFIVSCKDCNTIISVILESREDELQSIKAELSQIRNKLDQMG